MTIKLTKKTHACVRLEKDGQTLVIDPGGSVRRTRRSAPTPFS